jgi:TPP-dependent pyruvate/acetoin dehydrogenase alpha subunit
MKDAVAVQVKQAITDAQNAPEPAAEDTYNDLYVTMEVPR